MGLKLDSVSQACQQVSREIRDTYRELSLHYILFHEGQQLEALALSAQQIAHHPAVDKALHMMRNTEIPSQSSYLGTVIEKQRVMGGLSSNEAPLSIFSINVDQFETLKDIKAYAYHLAWHGIHAVEIRRKMSYKERKLYTTMSPPNNLVEMGVANLRADVFSSIMCALNRDKNAVTRLSAMRGISALDKNPNYKPETYPFVLAMESTQFAIGEYLKKTPPKRKRIYTALKISREIATSLEVDSIKHWLAFAEPAQEMAWQGYSKEQILGSAIYISQDTHVRATGHLVADITNIEPVPILETKGLQSSYADNKTNEQLHEKSINSTFEELIAQGLIESSGAPFIEEANRQNEALIDGRILGWCAAALQDAANAFENALVNGRAPAEQAARDKFQDERQKTTWDQLKQFGREIIKQYRLGKEMTFDNIINTCENAPQYATILNAVNLTINDPSYMASLEAANDLSHRPAPKAPEPAVAAPNNAPQAAPSMGMGGSKPHTTTTTTTTTTQKQEQGEEQGTQE